MRHFDSRAYKLKRELERLAEGAVRIVFAYIGFRPFCAPWLPVVSTVGVLVNGCLTFFLGRENWVRLRIDFGYSRHHSALRSPSIAETTNRSSVRLSPVGDPSGAVACKHRR